MHGDHTRDLLVAIGEKLEELRRDRGLTVEVLAERSDLSRVQVQAALKGERDLGIFALIRLAGAVGVSPAELLEGTDWIPGDGRGGQFRFDTDERD